MARVITVALIFAASAVTAQEDLIPDRRAPQVYPTLAAQPDQAGALDGSSPETALQEAEKDETLAAMMTVVANQGCAIDEADVASVFGAAGFTRDEVSTRLTGLLIEGVAGIDASGRMTFPAALCPPDNAVPSPRDDMIEAFRAAPGCRMTEAELADALPEYDLERLTALAASMVDAGELSLEGGNAAVLGGDLCGG